MGALVESLCVGFGPPVLHVAVGIILSSVIVEAVGHLVAYHHTDGSVVEGFVGLGIEEGILQDACREAYLVGRGVVVGVDSLRSHVPFLAVNGLAGLFLDMFLHSPYLASLHIVIETLCRVDVESAVVLPLVGVSNLHIEGRELPMGVGLGLGTHPRLGINALSESHAQVLYELLHHLLGAGGEVTLAVNLAQSLAHGRLCVVGGTLP